MNTEVTIIHFDELTVLPPCPFCGKDIIDLDKAKIFNKKVFCDVYCSEGYR